MKKLLTLTLVFAFAGSLLAEVMFTPYGMAQYRLRLKMYSTDFETGDDTKSMDYRNMIAYFIGTGAKVNDAVSFGFQIGNNSTTTEEAYYFQQKLTDTWISQAWAKMDAGVMNVTFGVLPVPGYGTLDLVERSLNTNTYAKAGQVSWPVGTNASLEGIKLAAPILKDGFKLGVELTQAIIDKRTQTQAKEPKSNPSSVMFLVNVPMSMAALTVTPEIVAILNRDVNSITEKTDNEIAGGLSAGYKLNDMVTLSAKAGVAMRSNANSYKDARVRDSTYGTPATRHIDTLDIAQFDYQGVLGGVGAVAAVGPGKLMLDFNISTNENKELAHSEGTFYFVDAKYAFCMLEAAKKNITIMPRVRLYIDQLYKVTKQEIWPELIFIGKF